MAVYTKGIQSASGLIFEGNGVFNGIEVITDGANNATATVYDNISGSGTELFYGVVTGASNFGTLSPVAISCRTGLYVTISGTGAKYIIHYTPPRGQ